MIFVVRHGERADQSNSHEERNMIERHFDPHLTKRGCQQAEVTGQEIKRILTQYAQEKKIPFDQLRIVVMSSPFLRCVTTASHLAKQLPQVKEIFLQEEICELMFTYDFSWDVRPKLLVRDGKQDEKRHEYLNQKYLKLDQLKLKHENFLDGAGLVQPKFPENYGDTVKRTDSFLSALEKFSRNQPPEVHERSCYICVTHQGYVENTSNFMKANPPYIDYCGTTQIFLNKNGLELGVHGVSFWKKQNQF